MTNTDMYQGPFLQRVRLLCTLTTEARYAQSFRILIPNWEIWLGRDSSPNMLKQVHKHQFLAHKPRLQLGETLQLWYLSNHTHSPPNLEGMSSDALANYLPSLVAVTLTQASNEHDKHRHVPGSIPTACKATMHSNTRSPLCAIFSYTDTKLGNLIGKELLSKYSKTGSQTSILGM